MKYEFQAVKMKKCFLITPIGVENSDTRKRADKVLKYIIEPILDSYKYEGVRADKMNKPGMITPAIINEIIKSELVIADLTGHNPNVFYELSLRHAIREPFVQIIDSNDTIPFDLTDVRTIQYDITDLDSVEKAKQKISSQIEEIENNTGIIDSPISTLIDTATLLNSRENEKKTIGKIYESIADLRFQMGEMNKVITNNYQKSSTFLDQKKIIAFAYNINALLHGLLENEVISNEMENQAHVISLIHSVKEMTHKFLLLEER